MYKFDLSGRTALITGGAGLLGREHAIALLESGAYVVLTDISEFDNQEDERLAVFVDAGRMEFALMDVTNKAGITQVAEKLAKTGRTPEILVNNAAIDPKVDFESGINLTRFEYFSQQQWDFQIAVGLTGAFLCSQVFGSAMAAGNRGGVILNIASDLSVFSPDQRIYRKKGLSDEQQPVKPVTYSVIKTGLIGLTRYLSTYWIEQGVRCNALSPGGVYTGQDEEFVRKLTTLIPVGRMANKDEYHSAVQFLCSDASAYLNGQNIVMDGGRSVW
jgi:NAD(P)-dependent dehydrogenase (short-subunit alcohol dehydrogenase family)